MLKGAPGLKRVVKFKLFLLPKIPSSGFLNQIVHGKEARYPGWWAADTQEVRDCVQELNGLGTREIGQRKDAQSGPEVQSPELQLVPWIPPGVVPGHKARYKPWSQPSVAPKPHSPLPHTKQSGFRSVFRQSCVDWEPREWLALPLCKEEGWMVWEQTSVHSRSNCLLGSLFPPCREIPISWPFSRQVATSAFLSWYARELGQHHLWWV